MNLIYALLFPPAFLILFIIFQIAQSMRFHRRVTELAPGENTEDSPNTKFQPRHRQESPNTKFQPRHRQESGSIAAPAETNADPDRWDCHAVLGSEQPAQTANANLISSFIWETKHVEHCAGDLEVNVPNGPFVERQFICHECYFAFWRGRGATLALAFEKPFTDGRPAPVPSLADRFKPPE